MDSRLAKAASAILCKSAFVSFPGSFRQKRIVIFALHCYSIFWGKVVVWNSRASKICLEFIAGIFSTTYFCTKLLGSNIFRILFLIFVPVFSPNFMPLWVLCPASAKQWHIKLASQRVNVEKVYSAKLFSFSQGAQFSTPFNSTGEESRASPRANGAKSPFGEIFIRLTLLNNNC